MNEQIVYSVLRNGSDAAGLGGVIGYWLLASLFIYIALTLRDLHKKGRSLESRSARSTWIRTITAKNATLIVTALSLVGAGLTLAVWSRYRSDRELLLSGNFRSLSGTLDEYLAVEITRNGRPHLLDNVAGFDPTLNERDRIVVRGQAFFIRCQKLREAAAAYIGAEGQCLNLHRGQQLRIDFVQVSPTQYQTGPLRISIIK